MFRFVSALVLGLLVAAPVHALCTDPGGMNQTSEPMASTRGTLATAPTPGSCSLGLLGGDLLISEIKVTEDRREFIEIYNPTNATISLDDYYITDYASEDGVGTRHGYWEIVTGSAFHVDNPTDFVAGFWPGLKIFAGGTLVIATGASTSTPPGGFLGGGADFMILRVSNNTPMRLVGGTPNGTLTGGLLFDNAEFVMLFKWDGACDLVCDVDYVSWGPLSNGNSRADKTSVLIDGLDGDTTPSAYLPDISANQQELTGAGPTGSIIRTSIGPEQSGGNGCLAAAVPVRAVTWGSLKTMFR